MPLSAKVLFAEPQHEIASLLRDKLQQCKSAWIVTGFATVEGVGVISPEILLNPQKLKTFVIGASTYRGFEALDKLLANGVSPERLYVHLGHTRLTTSSNAKYNFYRYHPMLHSKIYLFEMDDDQAVAFIGSHNATGFALFGLNGEASVMFEGKMNDPEILSIKQHIELSQSQSINYSPTMKEAYTQWTISFVEGLREKVNDQPRDSESKKTIVVLAVRAEGRLPQKDEVIYFEIPSALGQIQTLGAEVHIYVFASKPESPSVALSSLHQARRFFRCKTLGLEMEQGGIELKANWYIGNRQEPSLLPTPKNFRPNVTSGMQQVRVSVLTENVQNRYEYLFSSSRVKWEPILDSNPTIQVNPDDKRLLSSLNIIPPEDREWFLVRDLQAVEPRNSEAYHNALRSSAPESGSFILFSSRRRKLAED